MRVNKFTCTVTASCLRRSSQMLLFQNLQFHFNLKWILLVKNNFFFLSNDFMCGLTRSHTSKWPLRIFKREIKIQLNKGCPLFRASNTWRKTKYLSNTNQISANETCQTLIKLLLMIWTKNNMNNGFSIFYKLKRLNIRYL